MPCEGIPSCVECKHVERCGGDMTDEDELRECGECCSHYDHLNQCCWQATEKGLCFPVSEGDYCHLGYKQGDFR